MARVKAWAISFCEAFLFGTWGELEKRVFDPQILEPLAMLEILAVEDAALTFNRRGHDEGVVPGKAVSVTQPKRLAVQSLRRVDCGQGAKYGREVLFGISHGHGFREAPKGNIEEFLYDLVADDAFASGYRLPDQLCRTASFRRDSLIKRINEDVGIEKESTVHSSRPA
jgi:hypothetical protein